MLEWLRGRKSTSKEKPESTPEQAAERTPEATSAAPASPGPQAPAAPPVATPPADRARAQTLFDLANQALGRGQFEVAEKHLRQAVGAQPDHVQALSNLGAVLRDLKRPLDAEPFLKQALVLQPRSGSSAFNLGLIRLDQRRWSDAAELLRTAASAQPKDADAHYWLGNALIGQGDAIAARKAFQAALRCDPKRFQARWGETMAQIPTLAMTVAEQEGALPAFTTSLAKLRAWFRAQPTLDGSAAVGAVQPYYLAYREDNLRDALADYGALCTTLMAAWAKRAGVAGVSASGGAKVRVGIVSAHIQSHSVWHALVRGWIEHLDPTRFELHVFHTGMVRDAETEWAERRVTRFHQGVGDWKAWVRAVSDSRPDVLLYPEIGMDAVTTRLASLRLARCQLASWGHPVTSGLSTIDGYLSAADFEPADAATHYTERLIPLPRLGCSYQPYRSTPALVDFTSFGIGAEDRVLLCPGVPFKYGPQHDAVWVDIARQCAPCKLVFFRDADGSVSDRLQQRLSAAFAAAGLSPADTLCFVPWQSQAAFFAFLDRADVFLDTLGFSGFNTAMQAVERCTPMVAYEGRFMRGRFASAILRRLDLAEWVTSTPEGYVQRVVKLALDDNARTAMRVRMAAGGKALYADKAGVEALGESMQELLKVG